MRDSDTKNIACLSLNFSSSGKTYLYIIYFILNLYWFLKSKPLLIDILTFNYKFYFLRNECSLAPQSTSSKTYLVTSWTISCCTRSKYFVPNTFSSQTAYHFRQSVNFKVCCIAEKYKASLSIGIIFLHGFNV